MYYKVGDEVLAAVKICKVDSKAEDASLFEALSFAHAWLDGYEVER